jgi:CBS domain containing-hemolysin-like protein
MIETAEEALHPIHAVWQILIVALLIGANAFFVAAEFALVKIRAAQLRNAAARGSWTAKRTLHIVRHLDAYLSATQLGITLASLGLGWVGEPLLAHWIERCFHWAQLSPTTIDIIGYACAFGLITTLHIVFGELAPKSLALQMPRAVSLWTSLPLTFFYYLFYPFIWLLNGAANLFLRSIGVTPASEESSAISSEEMEDALMHAKHPRHSTGHTVSVVALRTLRGSRTTAEQIMTAHDDVALLRTDRSLAENIAHAQREGFARMPLYDPATNTILGVVHIRELLWQERALSEGTDLRAIAHSVPTFKGDAPLAEMLSRFRAERKHLALVVSETDPFRGIVTLEDVLEEIVGDIHDEFDLGNLPIEVIDEVTVLADGNVPLRDVANEMRWPMPDLSSQTVAAWCREHGLAQPGDTADADGLRVTVQQADLGKIRRVRLTLSNAPTGPA